MASYRRGIFLINKKFQLRFAVYVCAWVLALSFIYPIIIDSLFGYLVHFLPSSAPLDVIRDMQRSLFWTLVLLQAIFLGLTFLISIFMSHRIAGPIYKLSKWFDEAKKGNLKDDLFFRKKDHFKEIAEDYNEMIRGVKGILDQKTTAISSAVSELEPLARGADPETRQKLEATLAKLRAACAPNE